MKPPLLTPEQAHALLSKTQDPIQIAEAVAIWHEVRLLDNETVWETMRHCESIYELVWQIEIAIGVRHYAPNDPDIAESGAY